DNTSVSGGYAGMTLALLQAIDAGVKNITVVSASPTTYCIQSTVSQSTWRKNGPGADLSSVAC
ncbi:MAG TPA: hypothetical protein VF989_05165, partial [Polyangiaceae bacterium]